jgi:hypothetical protein
VDPRAIVQLEGLGQLVKTNNIIEIRTRDLPACSLVPQPTTLPRAPKFTFTVHFNELLMNRFINAVKHMTYIGK